MSSYWRKGWLQGGAGPGGAEKAHRFQTENVTKRCPSEGS